MLEIVQKRAFEDEGETMDITRMKRTAVSLLLILMLSFTAAAAGTQQVRAETQGTETAVQTPVQVSNIIKKGKYYYYRKADGSIRKKAGFVTDLGNLYYVRKGGKIQTGKTFKVGKNKYHAYKNGVIAVGVCKWDGKWYFSDANGRWIKKESIVAWNGNLYYLDKNGVVAMDRAVSFNNQPYLADVTGALKPLEIPDGGGNPVVFVAKQQVGVMTGKTYWKWYFHTKFIDTDRTPWCGTFVAWCYAQAGQYDLISVAKNYGNLGYVPSYSKYANRHNKWINPAAAKPGDIVVFGKNRHVGLVEGITDGCLITIEGNAGPTAAFGCGKAGAVCRRAYKLSDRDIKGVIHP